MTSNLTVANLLISTLDYVFFIEKFRLFFGRVKLLNALDTTSIFPAKFRPDFLNH
jgi:hypothetical protein